MISEKKEKSLKLATGSLFHPTVVSCKINTAQLQYIISDELEKTREQKH